MFSIGLVPSGSKDPFALRRAANGVIKILAEAELPLALEQLISLAIEQSSRAKSGDCAGTLLSFFMERLNFYLRDLGGYAFDVVSAVLAGELTTVADAVARAQALTAVRGSDDFLAISTAFKRIKNLLRQAEEKGVEQLADPGSGAVAQVAPEQLVEEEERRLYAETGSLAPQVEMLRANRQYPEALEKIAALRPSIDAFFDRVMVMVPEAGIRRNRLALLSSVIHNFSGIADFSEIAVAGSGDRPVAG
jgi:glycyl-tRNA synthetase beta chain